MATPQILQMLGQSPQTALTAQIKPIKDMMRMVQTANNPMAMMQALADKNPQIKQTMNMIQQAGGNPRDAFYALAKEKGVNPDDILNALK